MYAGNLKCVSRDPGALLRAARFTTGCVRLVGQEPAPSKYVLVSTSGAVRNDMRGWVVTDGVIGGLSSWMFGILVVTWILFSGLVGYFGFSGSSGHCPVCLFCFEDDSHRRDARHSHPCEDRRDAETVHQVCIVLSYLSFQIENQTS